MTNLKDELTKLQRKLRDNSKSKFNRVNPLFEDLIDWKEHGEYVFGKGKNTFYNSSCVVGNVEVGKKYMDRPIYGNRWRKIRCKNR